MSNSEHASAASTLIFHVAKGEDVIGQLSLDEILARIERLELNPLDHLYDEQKREWVAIIAHPEFSKQTEFWNKLNAKPTLAHPGVQVAAPQPVASEEAWYVLKGDHRFGPFSYLELIRLLQKKVEKNETTDDESGVLHEWDYVWTQRLPEWRRVSSLPEFQTDVIRGLRKELSEKIGGTVNEVFFRRRFARATFFGSILLHNNKTVLKGKTVELGAGGLSLQLSSGQNGVLNLGEEVHLHFKPSNETPTFNARCEVISRRAMNSADPQSPVTYGLKFLVLDPKVRTEIDGWATRLNQTTELSRLETNAMKEVTRKAAS